MRDYSKISPQFWIGRTGKRLRKQGPNAQLVALYLMTCPQANMLGLFYTSITQISHETGLPFEGASEALRRCVEAGFCRYDEESEVVWVMEMAHYQIADSLDAKDNRCKGIQNEYNALPDNPFLEEFFEKYSKDFNLKNKRKSESPSQAPSKPLRSQEQEQEQEQEQKQITTLVEQKPLDVVVEIFGYWQRIMNSPRSVLDADRRRLIEKALKSYTPADICKAIRGCSKSPHNMGQNEQKTKYNGLGLILRNAEKIDRFIQLDNDQAVAKNETLAERNARIVAEVMGDVKDTDENTIEMEA